ncbi:D-aminoacylase [Candidatus Aerophobetes bacterium]|nr:D-aminoacylase [Candidatus Aerophobetes bacterium]
MFMFDLIIKDGYVVDGTGKAAWRADVGVLDERISKIGSLNEFSAKKVIDVRGSIVCPGFVDFHSHADAELLKEPSNKPKLMQGVTTEVIGNCGFSLAPVSEDRKHMLRKYVESLLGKTESFWNLTTMGGYLNQLGKNGTGVNVASYVGHQALRIAVMGFDNRRPAKKEMAKMKDLLLQSLRQGAIGLSTGLIYPPGSYAQTEELVELCRVVAKEGGIYTTHIRSESDEMIESIREALDVGRQAGVPVHISHLKICGKKNWSKIDAVLNLILKARENGLDVTCDAYPYLAGSTMLMALLPPWVLEGGLEAMLGKLKKYEIREKIKKDFARPVKGWDNIVKNAGWENIFISWVYTEQNKDMEGKSLQEITTLSGKDTAELLFDLLIEEKGRVTMVVFQQCEENMRRIMKQPMVMFGSDGIYSGGKPHPRLYGTFPRILRKYVREEKLLSLEEAICKMTYLPNQKLGFTNRGLIKENFFADIVVFNLDEIRDFATYKDPERYPEGIEYVLVSGETAVEKGTYTGSLPGKVLFKQANLLQLQP